MKPLKKYPVIIFDFDGVVVDSEKLSLEAINYALNSFKISLDEDVVKDKYRGWQFSKIAEDLKIHGQHSVQFQETILSYLNTNLNRIKVIEGIPDLLESLRQKGIDFCITSNASVHRINKILNEKKLNHFFEKKLIFGKEMAAKGKPAPDLYQLSIGHFGKESNHFIAIEDSITGVISASMAQVCNIVGFIDSNSPTCPISMKESGCSYIINKIDDFYPMFIS
ncbi:HAD family hydrolase [Acinetobacter pecorum]|uniref:HAD family hydrolase n=1 Tax=Acinetobacter pecorum TaxID=2762215 RepID=UPI003EE58C20